MVSAYSRKAVAPKFRKELGTEANFKNEVPYRAAIPSRDVVIDLTTLRTDGAFAPGAYGAYVVETSSGINFYLHVKGDDDGGTLTYQFDGAGRRLRFRWTPLKRYGRVGVLCPLCNAATARLYLSMDLNLICTECVRKENPALRKTTMNRIPGMDGLTKRIAEIRRYLGDFTSAPERIKRPTDVRLGEFRYLIRELEELHARRLALQRIHANRVVGDLVEFMDATRSSATRSSATRSSATRSSAKRAPGANKNAP